MNLRQIEVFRAVMLTGSISGAAQLLHVSQPAVSRLISFTESRLKFTLFQRVKRRLHPTPEALKLFAEVDSLYQNVQRVNALASDLAHPRGASLRVVCSPSLAYSLLPLAIAAFARLHADVRITLDSMPVDPLIDTIMTLRADLAVAMVPLQHPLLEVHNLFRNRVVAVLPPGHRLLKRTSIRAADLKDERLIGYGAETPLAHAIDRIFDGARVAPQRVVEVKQTQVACALVQHGLGIALIDELALLSGAWPALQTRPLTPTVDLQVRIGYSRHEPLAGAAQAFVGVLQALKHEHLHPVA